MPFSVDFQNEDYYITNILMYFAQDSIHVMEIISNYLSSRWFSDIGKKFYIVVSVVATTSHKD